jgi:hypothetical protein
VQLTKNVAETLEALQTIYGDDALKTAVNYWYNHLNSGQEILEDKPRFGRTSNFGNAETISDVKELVHANRQTTIKEDVNEVDISCDQHSVKKRPGKRRNG